MVPSARRTRRVLIALCVAAGPVVACATGELGETDDGVVSEGDAAGEADAQGKDGAASLPDAFDDGPGTTDASGDTGDSGDASDASDASDGGTTDASDGGTTADASDGGTADASDGGTTPDASDDAGTTPDASDDAGTAPDASPDAGGPSIVFGASCTAPTIYTDSFATNPLNAGWQVLAGNVSYPGAGLFSLTSGSPNTQVWIGVRPAWKDYTISIPVRIDSFGTNGNGGVTFRMVSAGAANDSGQMYYAGITPTNVVLGVENGSWAQYAATTRAFTTGVFYTLTISASGTSLSVTAAGGGGATVVANHSTAGEGASTSFSSGSFGFRTFNMAMTYGPVAVTCN